MRKIIFLLTALLLTGTGLQAQERVKVAPKKKTPAKTKVVKKKTRKGLSTNATGWNRGGSGLINVSNTTLNNWVEGGSSTFALTGNLNLFADYYQGPWSWTNDVRFLLGFINGNIFSDDFATNQFRKNDDLIDFDSKLGYKISRKTSVSGLLEFNTQILRGDNYDSVVVVNNEIEFLELSKFFSPAVIRLSGGIDHKPLDWLTIFVGPSFKALIVADDVIANSGRHGNVVNANGIGENFKPELGMLFKSGLQKQLLENVTLKSDLELFSNLLENNRGEVKPFNLDVLWTTGLGMKVNKYIGANIEYTLKYDDEVDTDATTPVVPGTTSGLDREIQSRSFIGVGFSYNFGNRERN